MSTDVHIWIPWSKQIRRHCRPAAGIFASHLNPIKSINDSQLVASIVFESLRVSLIQASITKSGDVRGLDLSDGLLVPISLFVFWIQKADDDRIIEHFKRSTTGG